MYRFMVTMLVLLALLPTVAQPAQAGLYGKPKPSPSPGEKTLYERLGGQDALNLVVSDFYDRLQEDGDMRSMFIGIDVGSVKRHTVECLMLMTGGPDVYHGRDLHSAHARMKLTTEDWDHTMKILRESLAKYNVPTPESDELVQLVSGVRDQIVQSPSNDERGGDPGTR